MKLSFKQIHIPEQSQVTNLPNIILIGHINSGKTTCANYLTNIYKYNKYSLGDGVKKFIVDLYKILHKLDNNISEINIEDLYKRDVKENYRQHMQLLSTDLIRNYFGDNVWIDYLKTSISNYPFIIDDIRFKNEFETFKNIENTISIRITRDDEIKSNHISEHDIDNIETDYTIVNNGSLTQLYSKLSTIIKINTK